MIEAVLGLAHAKSPPGGNVTQDRVSQPEAAVAEFIIAIGAKEMVISTDIGRRALEAGRQYGKAAGHAAALNMGDCLAYACAHSYRLPLLVREGGLSRTDVGGV